VRKSTYRILTGDAIEQLRTLPDRSVQCVVTSPPYYALRDYGVDGQIGLEPTPADYVSKMVAVFREVRRVLRDDGTLWLNLGDSYAGYWGDKKAREEGRASSADTNGWTNGFNMNARPQFDNLRRSGLKPKDLIGIPWRVAFALQDDGWWLRSDIIWSKANPMPESVTDRPTKSHEYIFLLTKSARYYWDQEAVKEESVMRPQNRNTNGRGEKDEGYADHRKAPGMTNPSGRNIRTVWDIATEPYNEAHFATFPTEIPRRCIKAGTSEKGCCPQCGAPWRRVVDAKRVMRHELPGDDPNYRPGRYTVKANGQDDYAKGGGQAFRQSTTIGWTPTCICGAGDPVPCVVLDPFGGSGTTAAVAMELGQDAILCELNLEYIPLARDRIEATIQWIKDGKPGKKPKRAKVIESDFVQPGMLDLEI